jgi:hypothetical protein
MAGSSVLLLGGVVVIVDRGVCVVKMRSCSMKRKLCVPESFEKHSLFYFFFEELCGFADFPSTLLFSFLSSSRFRRLEC